MIKSNNIKSNIKSNIKHKIYTMIQISQETKTKLTDLKITRRESYDEIINRLIIEYKGGRLKWGGLEEV